MSQQKKPVKYSFVFVNPRWRKVFRDLIHNKTRTALVILSIAIGVFAIGMIASTQIIIDNDMSAQYLTINPASAILYPGWFDSNLVESVRRMEGIEDADGRLTTNMRIKVGPEAWKDIQIDIVEDFNDIHINKFFPISGAWPPDKKTILIERESLELANTEMGGTVEIETPDGKIRQLKVSGTAHDMNQPPPQFVGRPQGFITFETYEWLGYTKHFDSLSIVVTENKRDKEHIRVIADEVKNKIEKDGNTVYWTWIPEPFKHPADEAVSPMLLILGVLGALSLFLSAFLVINTISALLARQIKEIGIMKALGAQTGQLVQLYLVNVMILGLLASIIAIPLAAVAAYIFSGYLAKLINFDLLGFRIPMQALLLEIAVGIFVPLLAAAVPIFTGVRITVNEATSTYGLGKGQFGTHALDRAVEWLTGTALALTRPMRIAVRNTIRRKSRLALTLFTLTLGGAIFIAILCVHTSLMATLDEALTYWNYDAEVNFHNSHRISELEQIALSVPGVVSAESWTGNTARRLYDDGHEGPNFSVLGVPANTKMINPTLLEGRWLLPDDENAVVVNTELLKEEKDVKVGDVITFSIEGREHQWRVVGVVKGVMTGSIAYTNYPYFAKIVRYVGRSGGVQVVTCEHSAAFQEKTARALKDRFDALGLRVNSTETTSSIRTNIEFQFGVIVFFLSVMAVLIAVVGALGLMGTMSINVLERTREIGVMRAVGASDGAVSAIVMVEGLLIGALSWLIGALAGWPIGYFLSNAVGIAFMDTPLTFRFAFGGAAIWLACILGLAALASLLPARSASRLTIREVLAYE